MEDEHEFYLRRLHGFLSFANCAGEQASLRSLHQNRLIRLKSFKDLILTKVNDIPEKSIREDFLQKIRSIDEETPDREIYSLRKIRNEIILKNPELEPELTPHTELEHDFKIRPSIHYHGDLHVILGDPGYGKTVHIKQIAERFVQHLRRTGDRNIVPVFLKAKDITNSLVKDGAQNFQMVIESLASKNLGVAIREDFFTEHGKKLVLFVDAYDECRTDDLHHLNNILFDALYLIGGHVVLTSRNSHIEKIRQMEHDFGLATALMTQGHLKIEARHYYIDFTYNELCKAMPEKLLTAWGIDDFYTNERIKLQFASYKEILTHPVFVGIFSLMVHRGEIVVDPTLVDEGWVFKFKSDYTNHHVRLIDKVINLGVEFALERFETAYTPRFVDIFGAVSWVSLVSDTDDIENIIRTLKLLNIIDITDEEKSILTKGIGLLYSTDGDNFEWVHKILTEIGAADFVHKNPQHIHPQLFMSDCFMISIIIRISDDQKLSINEEPIIRLARFFSKQSTEDILSILERHSSWKKKIFKNVELYVEGKSPRLRLESLPTLDRPTQTLADFLIECSTSREKIPAHPIQFLSCIEKYLDFSDYFQESDMNYRDFRKYANSIKKLESANDYFLRSFFNGEELRIRYRMWLILPNEAKKHIFENVNRWILMEWFAKEYPAFIRMNELIGNSPTDEEVLSQESALELMESKFADLFAPMKEKIWDEYGRIDELGIQGNFEWIPRSTLDKFAFIYQTMVMGTYPDEVLPSPCLREIISLMN